MPRVLVTDELASYDVAHRRLIPSVEHNRFRERAGLRRRRHRNKGHDADHQEVLGIVGGLEDYAERTGVSSIPR